MFALMLDNTQYITFRPFCQFSECLDVDPFTYYTAKMFASGNSARIKIWIKYPDTIISNCYIPKFQRGIENATHVIATMNVLTI